MSLKRSSASGFKWSSASQFGRQALQLLSTAILARLLKPTDFGLIGMVSIVIGFVTLFKDLGTSAAVIQKKEVSPEFLSSIFWINAAFGILASGILYVVAPYVAVFYHEPLVKSLMRLLSLSLFISSLSISHQSILERQMSFRKLAKLELTATLCGSAVGIGGAVLGYGVWSLVFQTLTVAAVTTMLLWTASGWYPSSGFHRREISSVLNYSANLTGFNIFNYFVRNADYLLIGKFLGAQDLGCYTLAYRIMLYPLQSITQVITRVMFPALSQIQEDDERLRHIYLKIVGSIALVTFPLMLGLIVLSHPFVSVGFGMGWPQVAQLLIIFAPVGMVQSVGATVGVLYQAKGRTDWMFRWGMATGALAVISFVIGLNWGILGVATAYAIYTMLILYHSFAIPFKLINLNVASLVAQIHCPLLCSLLMGAAVYGARLLLASLHVGNTSLLMILIPFGAALYLTLTWFINRNRILDVVNALKVEQ